MTIMVQGAGCSPEESSLQVIVVMHRRYCIDDHDVLISSRLAVDFSPLSRHLEVSVQLVKELLAIL